MAPSVVVLGAGVAGLTTACTLLNRFPSPSAVNITVVGKHLPGDSAPTEYCSPQAGANWCSFETEWNQYAHYDKVSFERFLRIAAEHPESGVKRFPMRLVYGNDTVRSTLWFEDLVGGVTEVPKQELPEGADWGIDLVTFMYNPNVYLSWLHSKLVKAGVSFRRRWYSHIDDVMSDYPNVSAVFNCTGLGARDLGGVKDEKMHPTKGQTILIAEPTTPVQRMAIWSQQSLHGQNELTHVFPRPLGGGIIIGGLRRDYNWDDSIDTSFIERTKQRACQLVPELGKPEELQVIRHNIGLRPSRTGGARVDIERRQGRLLIHNYGAGGAGYQSSWGMAEHAVDLWMQQNGSGVGGQITAKL